MRRRRFLAAVSGALAMAAGCLGDGDGSTPDGTPTPTAAGPSTSTASGTPAGDYEARAREFVALIDRGEYAAAHERFTAEAAEAIPVDRLGSTWADQESQLGPFRSFDAVETAAVEGGNQVTGHLQFENGRLQATITFTDAGITGFLLQPVTAEWTPPAYADADAFEERTVTLSATDTCSLGGTLSIPADAVAGETPGVVLVHGQGPMDRDGTFGPNRVYRDLAWGLASEGVAVLRYAKRSYACDVDMADATIHDVVTEDALTAVERLRATEAVTPDDVVVAGHSVGGTLTPEIARRDGNLAGIAVLAGLYRPAHEAILDQNQFLVERDGTVTEQEEAQLEQVRELVERIRTLDIPDDETAYLGGDEYWRSLQEYDHGDVAAALSVPQLYLQGGRDWQVTVEADFQAWQDVLAGTENVSFELYDDLNHHFMPGSGTPSQAEYFRENHVAERVVTDLAAFADRVTSE